MIVPCYNEAARFDLAYWQDLIRCVENCRWIFVDDGSTDNTNLLLESLKGDSVELIGYTKNRGKGEAIRFGFSHARLSELVPKIREVGFLDADAAFHKDDIFSLLAGVKHRFDTDSELEVLIGSRVRLAGREIRRNPTRHYVGRVISSYISNGWLGAPYDSQSGFKIFRANDKFWKSIQLPFKTSWFFDIELIIRMSVLKPIKIWEEPLLNWREVNGGSIKFRSTFKILGQIHVIRRLVLKHIREMGV